MQFALQSVAAELGSRPILQDISFVLGAGERIVLLGVNGSGKSTLLKLLDGLLFPVSGTISYEQQVLDRKALEQAGFRRRFRSEVTLLFQNVDAMLFNPTVADEIAFGPRQLGLSEVDARVAHWAGALRVDSLLERPPFELSGGEKKRVALAAILALDPRVLLLDEPTAGLDPASAAELIDLLAHLNGVSVIASTHNLSVADELGQRALLLGRGRAGVLFDGATVDLLANESLLIESGLAHRHLHRHTGSEHSHFHIHDGE